MLRTTLALAAMASLVQAQDPVLYFKFDSGCGTTVLNFGTATGAPDAGKIVTNTTSGTPWVPGKFGLGIFGSYIPSAPSLFSRVESQWNPGTVDGSFAIAFWMVHTGLGTPGSQGPAYLCGVPTGGGMGLFTDGTAGNAMALTGWAPGAPDLLMTTDIRNRALASWVHVAVVVDANRTSCTFYVDGQPETPLPLPRAASWSANAFHIAEGDPNGFPSAYLIDEFVFVEGVLTPLQVQELASSPRAAVRDFGARSPCTTVTLSSQGGDPFLGNNAFALNIQGSAQGLYTILIGSDRCTFAGNALPLDLGAFHPGAAGCLLLHNADLAQGTGLFPAGQTHLLPIPNDPALDGLPAWAQAMTLDTATGTLAVSNGLALALGQ